MVAIGAPTLFETGIVTIGETHWLTAVEAFWRYGEGRHPAALNYGDCMSYATARIAQKPEALTRIDEWGR
ncbi:MAG: type II toxin-antitoxin system VapC family toxin [Actinobacteria bacterium]|nr:type II toxin-antitoxin system VapC family toxin [Actinomycetota bacterium]